MSSDPSGPNARGDVWLAAFFLALFGVMMAVGSSYPWGAGTLPVLVGGLGVTLSAWELLRARRRLRVDAPVEERQSRPGHLAMFAWLAGAVASVVVLGILIGGAAFVGVFLYFREGDGVRQAVLAGLTLSAVLHLALERGLGLRLFAGVLFS